jgi:hypothetical protein
MILVDRLIVDGVLSTSRSCGPSASAKVECLSLGKIVVDHLAHTVAYPDFGRGIDPRRGGFVWSTKEVERVCARPVWRTQSRLSSPAQRAKNSRISGTTSAEAGISSSENRSSVHII